MSAVSSTFRAHFSEHSWTSAISLSLLVYLFQPRLARNLSGQELSPTHASLRSATADHDYYFELLFLEEERTANQLLVLVHTMAISGLTRVSTWADGPRNLRKISWSRMHNRTGMSGETEFPMEKLRPSACLIRSVRD
jgi:hypothetical protein